MRQGLIKNMLSLSCRIEGVSIVRSKRHLSTHDLKLLKWYHWPDIASRVCIDEIFVVLHQIEIKQFAESTSLGGLTDEQIVGLGKLWSDVTNAHIKLHGQRSKRRQPLGRAFYVVPLQWVATSKSSWAPNPSSPSINSSKSAAAQPQQFRPRTYLSTIHVCMHSHITDPVGRLPIALPPEILLHGYGRSSVIFGRHDGLVAHHAGRRILAHGCRRFGVFWLAVMIDDACDE